MGKTFWAGLARSPDAETRGFAEDLYRVATLRADEIDALIVETSCELAAGAVAERGSQRAPAGLRAEMLGLRVARRFRSSSTRRLRIVSRRYSTPESVGFLNGVLDAMAKELIKQI